MSTADTAPAPVAIEQLRTLRATIEDVAKKLTEVEIPTESEGRDTLQIFAAIDQAAKRLEALQKKAKETRDGLNDRVLETLVAMGVQNAPLKGGPTVFQERTLWAGNALEDVETDEAYGRACDALEAAGLGEYVQRRYNVQSLSGYFRERERELEAEIRERDGLAADVPVVVDPEELLPEELRGVVKVTETVKAKARKT